MDAVVVDTDVVSLTFKGDSRAEKYRTALAASDLLVAFMTEAELERWILQSNWGPERTKRFRTNNPGDYRSVPAIKFLVDF